MSFWPASQIVVFEDIHKERARQDAKWGEQNHPIVSDADRVFSEGMAIKTRAICDEAAELGVCTWYDIAREEFFEAFAESDPAKQRKELIECAAVLVAAAECIDRKGGAQNGQSAL